MAPLSLWTLGALHSSPVDPFRTVWSEAQGTLPASFPLPPRAPELALPSLQICDGDQEPGGIAILPTETVSPPPLTAITRGPWLLLRKSLG